MLYTQNPYYNVWYIVDDQQTFNEYIWEREMNVGREGRRMVGKYKKSEREEGRKEKGREEENK